MITGSVRGQVELRHVQAQLDINAPKKMQAALLSGTRAALAPLKKDIQASSMEKMPHRGGYAALLAKAIRVVSRVSGGARVTARVDVSAVGKEEVRDLAARNEGSLRHPVFGRWRRTKKGLKANPWVAQRVRPRVVDEPVDDARDRLVNAARKAADEYVDAVTKG